MADGKERVTVSIEELAVAYSLALTALVEILEEKGLIKKADVMQRVQDISDRKPTQ